MALIGQLNIKIGATIEGLQTALVRAERSMNKSATKMTNIGKRLSMTLSASIGIAGVAAVKTAAEFETLQNGLNILTGSVDDGTKAFERLKQFSAKTPFQLQELTRANNIMMGFGLSSDEAFDSLNQLGNIAAVMGSDFNRLAINFGQVSAAGHAMTRDIREFINNGVPMWDLLSDATGKSIGELQEMATKQEITFDIISKAFDKATKKGGKFYKGLEKGSKTLQGVFSTMKDNISLALGTIGQSIAETLNLREVAIKIGEAFGKLADRFASLSEGQKRFIVITAAMAAAIGPLLVAMGSLLTLLSLVPAGLAGTLGVAGLVTASIVGLTLAIVKLRSEYNKVGGLSDKVTKRIKNQSESYLKEKKNIDKLRHSANNLALTIKQRQKAYDELVTTYPDYFDAMKIEEGEVFNIVKRYDQLIDKLKDVARQRAISDAMTDLTADKVALEIEVSAMFPGLTLDEIQEKIEYIAKESNKDFGDRLTNNLKEVLQQLNIIDDDWLSVENQLDQINALNKEINKLAKMGGQIIVDDQTPGENGNPDSPQFKANEKLAKLEAERQQARNAHFKALYDRNLGKEKELAGIESERQQSRNEFYKDQYDRQQQKEAELGRLEAERQQARNERNLNAAKELKSVVQQIGDIFGQFGNSLSNSGTGIGAGFGALFTSFDMIKNIDFSSIGERLSLGFENIAGDVIAIAGSIGNAITGISQAVAMGIQNQMNVLDESYQKQMDAINSLALSEDSKNRMRISAEKKYDRQMAALKKRQAQANKVAAISQALTNGAIAITRAFAELGPIGGGIASGVIAGVTAAQISSIQSQPIPQFANGGIVNGRTLAEVGEYGSAARGNPEVIAPLNKLKSMLGDMGGNNISGEFRMRGDDLVAVVDKANRNMGRFSGKTQF
jgi:tape measure domain-containing protein